jgi:acylaminoacyl-peptidase
MVDFCPDIVSSQLMNSILLCTKRAALFILVVGQYPSTFTGAVLANPVISGGEIAGTDIPDWYYAEFGLGDDLQTASAISHETYEKLQAMSPIAHVKKVTAGVLLLVGASDKRVAPTQGINYYHALKAAGRAETEMLLFPGQGHGLEGVEETRVRYEATRDWFVKLRQ